MILSPSNKLFIGGHYVDARSGIAEPVINPANGEVIADAPVGGTDDIDAALEAASTSFQVGIWRRMAVSERVAYMQAFYKALETRADDIMGLIVAEAGATLALARFVQFGIAMKHFRHQLQVAMLPDVHMAQPEVSPNPAGGKTLGAAVIRREPVGVVSAITPYNYPYFLNLAKIVPALLMGNSIVLKPSPFTPFEALLLGEAAREARLPDGVLNIVTGDIAESKMLTTDPRVDLVTFTGSDVVGARIMAQAAPALKRVLMELGGKSALIVREDADLDAAVLAGVRGFTSHCGQGCALLTRHLVHNSLRKTFVEKMKLHAEAVKVGDPADASTHMGPLIRASQRERVERYVDEAKASGAKLVTGGSRPAGLDQGFYYKPTFFDDVDNSSPIAQDEVFGPVGVVIGFDTDEEAIALANQSQYGLNAAIFSADVGSAYEMACELRTGGVSLNGGAGTMLSDAPFGGIKRSGFGREYGREGLLEYTMSKSVAFHAG